MLSEGEFKGITHNYQIKLRYPVDTKFLDKKVLLAFTVDPAATKQTRHKTNQ